MKHSILLTFSFLLSQSTDLDGGRGYVYSTVVVKVTVKLLDGFRIATPSSRILTGSEIEYVS